MEIAAGEYAVDYVRNMLQAESTAIGTHLRFMR